MKFLKENSYDIIRLIINQVGITIFAFVIYTAVGSVKIESRLAVILLRVGISVFSALFYYALIYTVAWDWGAKDKIRIDAGRIPADKFKGLKMSLIANVPNFVLAFLYVLTFGIYALGVEGIKNFAFIFNFLARFWMAIYLGAIQGAFIMFENNENLYFFMQGIGYLIIPVISVFVTHLGYTLGSREKRMFGFLKRSKQA